MVIISKRLCLSSTNYLKCPTERGINLFFNIKYTAVLLSVTALPVTTAFAPSHVAISPARTEVQPVALAMAKKEPFKFSFGKPKAAPAPAPAPAKPKFTLGKPVPKAKPAPKKAVAKKPVAAKPKPRVVNKASRPKAKVISKPAPVSTPLKKSNKVTLGLNTNPSKAGDKYSKKELERRADNYTLVLRSSYSPSSTLVLDAYK